MGGRFSKTGQASIMTNDGGWGGKAACLLRWFKEGFCITLDTDGCSNYFFLFCLLNVKML